jgi:Ca2+-binding EF-hand superfamily protein
MVLAETKDLLDRKFDVCFTHGDVNGNGVLEKDDSMALVARILANLGEPNNSPKAQKLFQEYENFWTSLQANIDFDGDGKITPEEWRKGLRQSLAENPQAYKASFHPLAEAIFTVCDRDGDGFLQQSELAKYHQAFGCTSENSQLAFEKLDIDRDGKLTISELLSAWEEYYTSNDPNAPGNWLYGDVWDNAVAIGKKTM